MGNCKFYKQQKQVSYDNGTIWTNVTPSEFQKGELYEPNSQDCSTTMYRWVESGDTYCGEYALSKQLYIKQISIDSGITWNNVVPLETEERDIAYACTAYRWVNLDPSTDYYCDGTAKYYKQQKQVSYDGTIWTDVTPSEFQKGELYKPNSLDCGYIPSIDSLKLIIIKKNSDSAFETPCDSTSAITRSDVSMTRSNILSVKIGDCVTSIGEGTFSGCTSLSSVTIGSGVTSISNRAFYGCTSLSSVTIPSGVTSISNRAFYGCTSLSSVTIPSGVTSIGGSAFVNCSGLTSVTIPDSVTSISTAAFWGCTSLPSITIPYGITSIGDEVFRYCTSLSSVTIPDSVTSIGGVAFNSCSNLSSVTIGTSITSIGKRAFYLCNSLTSITVHATTPPSLGENVFAYTNDCPIYVPCQSLFDYKSAWSSYTSRIQGIPPCEPTPTGATKIQTSYSNGDVYFKYCDSSSELTSGETRPSGYQYSSMTSATVGDCVTLIGNQAFRNCTSLSSITISSGVTSIGNSAFLNCSGLTSINIPNSVTTISDNAFYRCSGLTSCTIGSRVTTIGVEAFRNCSSLTSITVHATTPPTLSGSNVFNNTNDCPIYVPCQSLFDYKSAWSSYTSRIQGIPPCEPTPTGATKIQSTYSNGDVYFKYCDSSTELTSGETQPSGYTASAMTSAEIGSCVASIGNQAFRNCTSLSSITIPNSVTSIGNSAFENCSSLTSVTISDSVTSIGWDAFYRCSGLTSCTIGSGVTSIGDYAFYDCRSLTSVIIPNSVTTISTAAFWGCTSLPSITIPYGITSIGDEVFRYCTSLSSVTIPDSVTSIGGLAFNSCSNLSSVTIGTSITSIGKRAFYTCSSLQNITVLAPTPPTLETNAFTSTNNCPIYVPAASVDAYKSSWSSYADRIQPIT